MYCRMASYVIFVILLSQTMANGNNLTETSKIPSPPPNTSNTTDTAEISHVPHGGVGKTQPYTDAFKGRYFDILIKHRHLQYYSLSQYMHLKAQLLPHNVTCW